MHKLFKTIGIIDPNWTENNTINAEAYYFSPQCIWFSMLESALRSDGGIKYQHEQHNDYTYEIVDRFGYVIVVISRRHGSWKYVHVTADCVNRIFEQYDQIGK